MTFSRRDVLYIFSFSPCLIMCITNTNYTRVCVCVCARIVTDDDIDMITHHLSGDIATTDDVIGS